VSKSKIRIINIILCVAILATLTIACNKSDDKDNKGQETTKTATEPVDSKPAKPDVLEVTRCLYFGDATDNPDLKEEFMKEFENKTGQKLKVNAIPRNGYMEKINLMLTSGELKGMVSIFGPNDVMKAMEDGVAEPFDDYLKDNANWNKLSQEYRESFKFDDKIYGVNGGYTGNFFTRTLRKDWLDNLGLDVPETVDDLFEVAKAFTENDPDKNGKDDTGGLTAAGTWNLGDIFQAFDARLDNTSSGSITWDAKEGVWIDSMLKPEMIDALKYLKKLYDNKYLDNEFLTNKGNNMREKIYTGKFGSTFYWSMFGYTTCRNEMAKNLPEAKMVEVPALKGKRTEKLNHRVLGGVGYILVKGTKQPKETANAFVDLILTDKDAHMMARYGIEGKTFKWEGDTIVVQNNPETGKPYDVPGLTADMPEFGFDKYPMIYDGTAEEKQLSLEDINIKNKLTSDGFSSGLLFDVPSAAYDSPSSTTFTNTKVDYYKLYDEVIASVITGSATPEDAVKTYREQMKALGGDKILEEANAAIGKTPTMKY
jgi:putative aldouronate transport system substrate-binding protein